MSADSYPFLATDIDLSNYGYVEEEYFISGDGYTYDSSGPNDQTATRNDGDGTYPFKTRIVVRRPADPADANGKVLAEWNNVTATQDIEWNWFGDPYYLLKHGYTFVGVTAQNTGVNSLKAFNSSRYGDLTVNGDGTIPTGPGLDSDALSYDVYSSAIKAIRGGGTGVDPMGGIDTDLVIASGESQSCGRLSRHYNKIEPLHEIVDAYLLTVCGSTLRTDRPEKVVQIITETENRTPRSAVDYPDTNSFRLWEIAAGSHLSRLAWDNIANVLNRDFIPLTVSCEKFPLSLVQWPFTQNRATDALVKWVESGVAPPIAPRGEYEANPDFDPLEPPSGSNPEQILKRDEYGIALGGIRYPEVTVPTATNDGINSAAPGGSVFSLFCGLLGSSTPFTQDQLGSLYTDYADYVVKYAAAADAFGQSGFILPEDVDRLKEFSRRFAELRPTAPLLVGDANNKGNFGLTWVGTEAPDTTFELQRAAAPDGENWAGVSADIDGRSASLAGEPEGTHRYRVRNTTILPATNITDPREVVTPFSEALDGVKVDRTGPKKPQIIIKGKRYRKKICRVKKTRKGKKKVCRVKKGKKGKVFRGKVKVRFKGRPDRSLPDGSAGVGLKNGSVPKPRRVKKKGRIVIKAKTKDRLGNPSKVAKKVIRIKK